MGGSGKGNKFMSMGGFETLKEIPAHIYIHCESNKTGPLLFLL